MADLLVGLKMWQDLVLILVGLTTRLDRVLILIGLITRLDLVLILIGLWAGGDLTTWCLLITLLAGCLTTIVGLTTLALALTL